MKRIMIRYIILGETQAVSPGQEDIYLYNSGADPGEVDWVASNPSLEQGKANGNMSGPQQMKKYVGRKNLVKSNSLRPS